jgi:hypothetical protein
MLQENSLAVILRDYVAQNRNIPGLRVVGGARNTSAVANNGGDYVGARTALLYRYVLPWLSALHDQQASVYGDIIYELCFELCADDDASAFLAARDDAAISTVRLTARTSPYI